MIQPTQHKVVHENYKGFREKKWDEKKEKREEVATKMIERFENMLTKKEEACVKHNEVKKEKEGKEV